MLVWRKFMNQILQPQYAVWHDFKDNIYEKVGSRTFRRFPESGPLLVFLPIRIFLLVILASKRSRKRKEKKRAKPIVGRGEPIIGDLSRWRTR